MKLLIFITLAASALLLPPAASSSGGSGLNLYGKMFTLSAYEGGLIIYSPNIPPPWSTTPYTTTRRPYTTRGPYTTTRGPHTTTRGPHTTTRRPHTTTRGPYTTTRRPYTTTRGPHTTTRRPHTTTRGPHTTTRRPHTTTRGPHTTTRRPYTTRGPYTTTRGPYTTTRGPHTTTRGPHTTTRGPYTTTRGPHTTTRGPYTTTRGPYTTTRGPYTTTKAPPTTTRAPPTTTLPTTRFHTTTPWTTAPTTRGVSVCLRYITDSEGYPIFTLSPSSTPLRLRTNGPLLYTLSVSGYSSTYLQPSIRLWPDMRQDMWTSICITVDTTKNVVQMFRNSNMSSRKLLPSQYTWSGEPVIDFSGFEGQVTDVQVWDYPLRYKEVLYYMSSSYYGPYQGSVLNWSYISYSARGKTLLEENYEQRMQLPSDRATRGRRLKWDKNPRKGFNFQKSKERRRQMM